MIEAEKVHTADRDFPYTVWRLRVPGGWLYQVATPTATCPVFVPEDATQSAPMTNFTALKDQMRGTHADLRAWFLRSREENARLRAALRIANDALAKFCSHQLSHLETFEVLGAAWKNTRRALEGCEVLKAIPPRPEPSKPFRWR